MGFTPSVLRKKRRVNYDDSEGGVGILVSYRFRYGTEVGLTRACAHTGYIFSLHSISRLLTHSVYVLHTQIKSHPSPRFRAVVYQHHDFPHHTALDITLESKIKPTMPSFFSFFFFMHFFSGTKLPREDNPNLYYWAEMTRLHTQTFNI